MLSNLSAATWFVDTVRGDDEKKGDSPERAFRTIQKALSLCTGLEADDIRVLPSPFPVRETIAVSKKNYRPEAPLVIDGGGNWFVGSEPIPADEWKPHESLKDTLVVPHFASRFPISFFVVNGRPVRMGRGRIFPNRPLPAPEALLPDEWTLAGSDLVLRILPGYDIREYQVERAFREAGIQFYGSSSRNVIVSNARIKFVTNDGVNLHCKKDPNDYSRDISFLNVDACWNWDEGISAHDLFEYTLSNSLMIGNNCGIVNIESAKGVHKDLILAESPDFDLFFYTVPGFQDGSNVFANSFIQFSKSWRHLYWRNQGMTPSTLVFDNTVLIHPKSSGTNFNFAVGGMRTLIHKTTIWDESERPFASSAFAGSNVLEISDSLFSFKNPARLFQFSNPDAVFKSKNNAFSKTELSFGGRDFSSKNEAAFRSWSGDSESSFQEVGFQWDPEHTSAEGRGADLSPAMKEKLKNYLDGALLGKGFAL
ncbi:MAG: hypothetical protein JNM63_14665, partial [Spirochaetia bacterium]|nr:hypothetical protein [Spirochaetia bacterium]